MVFSSVPAYLDPSNWQQQHIIGSSSAANTLLPPPPPPPPQPHGGGAGSGSGSIRPGSMSERARLANIPMPETALKCPRCESTNTKFCYFNNYSLSQPRHFCKTCRRYWTRGGALRSVPVGGGCRRNKRTSKSTSSKSPASSNDRQTSSTSTSTISTTNNGGTAANILNLTPPQFPSLRFMSPLGDSFAVAQSDMGLNYSGIITAPMVAGNENMNFHGSSTSSLLGLDPWRLQQQFPFLGGGLDPTPPPPGVYSQFQGGGELGFPGGETFNHQHPQARPKFSASLLSQLASVKMEDQNPDLRFSRQLLGGMQGNIIDWNNNNNNGSGANNSNWTDLSSFSSSSTSNPLQ